MARVESTPSKLSSAHHGVIGALVGSIEMCIMMPTVYWKTQLQQGQFSIRRALNPLFCYRGLPVAITSVAPVTCIQFTVNNSVLRCFQTRHGKGGASDGQRIVAGALSGFTAALAHSPMQLVEVNQQNHGKSMFATASRVIQAHGIAGLYKAYPMTAIREGIFVTSYMAAAPLIQRSLQERFPEMPEGAAMASSAVVAGGLGGFLSHPADTLKTKLQGGMFPNGLYGQPAADNSYRGKFAEMRKSGPCLTQLYAGFAPRALRIICCTFIYGTLKDFFENRFSNLEASLPEGLGLISVVLPVTID